MEQAARPCVCVHVVCVIQCVASGTIGQWGIEGYWGFRSGQREKDMGFHIEKEERSEINEKIKEALIINPNKHIVQTQKKYVETLPQTRWLLL